MGNKFLRCVTALAPVPVLLLCRKKEEVAA
jgi:hypothetical protein